MVVAEDLPEEDGQRDQGGIDAAADLADLPGDDLGDPFGRDGLAEAELGVEGDGAEQGGELCGGQFVVSIGHDRPSL